MLASAHTAEAPAGETPNGSSAAGGPVAGDGFSSEAANVQHLQWELEVKNWTILTHFDLQRTGCGVGLLVQMHRLSCCRTPSLLPSSVVHLRTLTSCGSTLQGGAAAAHQRMAAAECTFCVNERAHARHSC